MANRISADFISRALSLAAGRNGYKEGILTFLVGMVGSDGVLLASDRKHVRVAEVRTGFNSEKIFISKDRQLAYCSSGDEFSNEIGQSFLKAIKTAGSDDDFRSALETHIREFMAGMPPIGNGKEGSVLLGRIVQPHAQIWHLDVRDQPTIPPEILCVDDKTCEGDRANSASFFGDAYFPRNNSDIPVAQLRLLAAHSVLMASVRNSEYIDGLDMAESTAEGFRKLTAKELKDLTTLSTDLYDKIREWLLPTLIAEKPNRKRRE